MQRALDYACAALTAVTPPDLDRPSPCTDWTLAGLLAHMDDALDAFAEAADGAVGLRSAAPAPLGVRVQGLQTKACGLLTTWMNATTSYVDLAGHPIPVDVVARLAALEIAVHGWDVAATVGGHSPLPERLAEGLLPTALQIALAGDDRFAPPLSVEITAPAGVHVLALLGRTA